MQDIKLNKVDYLRGKILKAWVDETTLDFRNGIALAKVHITSSNWPQGGTVDYECYGLIDDEFNEVYSDSLKADFASERNLMVLHYNEWGKRFGDNDFIIKVNCGDYDHSWTEYRHIRIVDGIPKLINNLSTPNMTSNELLIISGSLGNQTLYDVEKGIAITPSLYSIKESSSKDGTFDVIARITPNKKNIYSLTDNLVFKIDKDGKITSRVLSSLENDCLKDSNLSIIELISNRSDELAMREKFFKELTTTLLSESDTIKEGQTLSLKNNK